jgi:predicted CXXCH cytochrome family protein
MRQRVGLAAALLALTAFARAQGMATPDRVQAPGWWPTKQASRSEFVGAAACAKCHPGPAATQKDSAMARTLARAADSLVLRERESLAVRLAGHDYEITTRGGSSVLVVSKGGRSLSQPLDWAFGAGRIGQTFVYQRAGTHYESRVSYLAALDALAFTPSRALEAPLDLPQAAGRPIPEAEARRCFGCHTTGSITAGRIDVEQLVPGVTCEACHGPGAVHVAAVEQDRVAEIPHSIARPSRSDPFASVDFCGACHATWWDVTLAGERGIATLRSQPFRLQSSRCWGEGDSRLTCTACHDPHRPLERDALAYDARCLGCHVSRAGDADAHRARSCRVAARECVSCHMPKYEVPEMHSRFTDHLIRVVRERKLP